MAMYRIAAVCMSKNSAKDESTIQAVLSATGGAGGGSFFLNGIVAGFKCYMILEAKW
jgi:hypothetical protein